jgi:1-acyl-sn-glycerol-3-phosphate acyltransferase
MRLLCLVILHGRIHVSGIESVPKRGGALIVSNHVGTIDPPLSGAVIQRTDVYFMAKSEHFSSGFKKWLFYGYHAFPVNRGTADRSALRHSTELLESGHMLVLYPEGTRGPALRRAHPGAGFIAAHVAVPIIPMAVWGTERVLPKGTTRPLREHVQLRFGEPFRLPEQSGRRDHQADADYMMERIAALLPAEYRGVYGEASSVA